MAKKRVIRCLIIILTIVLAAGVEMFWLSRRKTIKQYKESQTAFGNPLMGYAPSAWYNEVSEDISLLYMDITWAELEPKEGVYNWASIDEENQISRWRKEGKHLVLRFVCDIPGEEAHRVMKNIWISRNGCMRRVERPANGMTESMAKVLHRIIIIRRSFPVIKRQSERSESILDRMV